MCSDIFSEVMNGVADPYENGTPAWGGGGTPRHITKEGNPLTCDYSDSVDWLRPKSLKRAVQPLAQQQRQGTGCPFAARGMAADAGGEASAVSASR